MGLVTLTFDRLTLKLICESHLKLGTFFPNLGTLGLCVVELGYKLCTRQTDRQTDGRTKQHLLPPFLRGGDTIIILYVLVASSNMCHCSTCIPGDSCVYTERHKVKHQYEMWLSVRSQSTKHTRPKGSRMMPPPGLQIYLWPRVILTFDLLTAKVDRFTPREPFVPICIKIGLFVFKISCLKVW